MRFSVPSGRRALAAALLLAVGAGAGCARNPVTGERQLVLISESQEIEMGRQAAQEAERSLGLVQDEVLQSYVQRIGADLAAESERPELPWTFRVVDDPTPNAFALPGGFIFVTRGLMQLMDNEAELASVLGHEIGHVTARHSVTQISRAQIAQLGLGLGTVLFPELEPLGGLASSGLGLLFLKYGRDAERQADDLGFRYALDDGYDVREMADVFEALGRISELEGQSPIPNWLATHPAPEERIVHVRERLAELPSSLDQSRTGRAEYLARIDGLVYGENPRNGFFRDGVFYHPDLAFRFAYPQGWKTQNTSQAVLLGSPQQDAMMQLTLAGTGGAEQAARAFLSQQGVQALQSRRESVNGLPAIVSYFAAQSQQGELRGVVAHLEHGGRTYQLTAFTPARRFAGYDRVFAQVIDSFGPVSDPGILNVQPDRIEVVTLDRAMSLEAFARRYPSAIELNQLAVLNQVRDVSARIEAGTRLKRVRSP